LKHALPIGSHHYFKNLVSDNAADPSWAQTIVTGGLEQKLIDSCNFRGNKNNRKCCVVVHVCRNSVDTHRDGQSKSVYILPVSITGEWRFMMSWSTNRKLKLGDAIKFNDYNDHSLEMTKPGIAKFFTVSFDDENS
jgi:hypothetical protein